MQRSYGTGNTGMLVSIDFQSHLSGAFNQKALLIRFLLCDSETSIFFCEDSFAALGDTETEARKPELLGILECTVVVTGAGLVLGTGS